MAGQRADQAGYSIKIPKANQLSGFSDNLAG
jgi:hypothetical protein